jgi:hypothetical protein
MKGRQAEKSAEKLLNKKVDISVGLIYYLRNA